MSERVEIAEITNTEEIESLVPIFVGQLREHGISTEAESLRASLKLVIRRPELGFAVRAKADGKTVGAAYVSTLLSLEHGGISGWLEELYVIEGWRNRGLGTALIEAVFAGAERRSWTALDLEVAAGHEHVMPLYERHGFSPLHRTRFARRL